MTDEQRDLLTRRLREATEQQPEIQTLRLLLLGIGGVELVAPSKPDSDVPKIVDHGLLMEGSLINHILDESGCHENVAELWLEEKEGLTGIGTGYALSEDGLWRQHSWGLRDAEIIETTSERIKYFGRRLTSTDADAFAEANRGDPEERQWRRLPEVWFRLKKDDDGYPAKDWEALKAELSDRSGSYRIKCVPFYAPEVGYGDEVLTGMSEEGYEPVFESVIKRSGYSTMRLWIDETEDQSALADFFTSRECLIEFSGRLAAIGIPETAFEEMSEYICSEKERGRWDAQDGYLIIDD